MISRAILLPAALVAASLSAQTDTTPPSVPANLAGTAASSTAAVLYWTQAEDDTAVTAYDIHRDGAFLRTHTDNTFTDTGLTTGSTHTYRIAARDAAGNVSALCDAVTVPTDTADNPRLVRPEHLTYLGAFVPPNDERNNYSYGGTAIAFNPARDSLFICGHNWYQLVGEISIPTPVIAADYADLPSAAVLQNQTDITEGHLNQLGAGGSAMEGCRIGGLLINGDRLLGTSHAYYDAGGGACRSHFTSSLNLAQTGDFRGMYSVGTWDPGFVAGHMAHVPPEWQAALGGPVITGLDGVPIVSRTSYGPTLSIFDPAQLGEADPVPATLLVGYTYEHATLGTWENSTEYNPQFNQAAGSRGVALPAGSDSMLLIGTTGIGVPCYGEGTDNPALDRRPVPGVPGLVYVYDPVRQDKGTHAYPYVAYIWAYRTADLARVASGQIQHWQAVPYASWEVPLPISPAGTQIVAGAAYDPATNRLFISRGGEIVAETIIHVFKLTIGTPPATYATWRAANWVGADLSNDALSGPLADPDRAGVSNLQRYGFALPAHGSVASPVTPSTATSGGASYLTLTFPRRATADGLTYTLESSPDLVTWTAVPDRTYTAGSGSITAQDAVAIGTVSRRFLRLRVTASQ